MSGGCHRIRIRFRMSFAEPFIFTLWTSDPAMARAADIAGIDRVGVDLEHLGKQERQAHRGTWISPHREEDLDTLRPALSRAKLFARTNRINPDSEREIESVLARGAQVLMLAMAMDAREAEQFVRLIDGRATIVLLIEHIDAVRNAESIASVDGVDEVHVGLNDLAISLGLANRWKTLTGDLMLECGKSVRRAGRRFGFGGIGRAKDDTLPIPGDLVYAEYARTGATAALVARSFFPETCTDLTSEVLRARRRLEEWRNVDSTDLERAHAELTRHIEESTAW
jgi:2-keto-3-deoxy-L-rhamnonate aldolase RhmA